MELFLLLLLHFQQPPSHYYNSSLLSLSLPPNPYSIGPSPSLSQILSTVAAPAMKKLHRKCAVHPSPSPPVSDHLAFLPAAILTLAAALSPADREVLAYLISCSNRGNTQKAPEKYKKDHSPVFSCDCFRCYTSYWVRWDTSANRQLIHEIIDAFEDGLAKNRRGKGRRERRRRGRVAESTRSELADSVPPDSIGEASSSSGSFDGGEVEAYGGDGGGVDDVAGEGSEEKGSVRKFVSFIGERFWGVWT